MRLLLIAIICSFAVLGIIQADDSYLEYSIPKNADKYGPISTRESAVTYSKYFQKGAKPENSMAIVGLEYYRNEILTSRKLYKNGKLHGVQKKWYTNGKLKMEAPYKTGEMHGLFKEYNHIGQLTSMYQMIKGNGTKLAFNNNGSIKGVEFISKNKGNGWSLEFYENGAIKSVNKKENGLYLPEYNAAFHRNGSIYIVALSNNLKPRSAIIAYYEDSGKIGELVFLLRGVTVNKDEYQKASKTNKEIPKLLEKSKAYKKHLHPDIAALIRSYKSIEAVKIPLKLNDEGKIVTKSGKPFILPK